MKRGVKLLPREHLIKTGRYDHASWNYRPVLGLIQKARFQIIKKLLGEIQVSRILEIGYGSGVLAPELAQRCDEIYGLDVHNHCSEVEDKLSTLGIRSKLYSGSAEVLPFEDETVDAIVAVSVLEYVDNLQAACDEMKRVCKPGAHLCVVTPRESWVLDTGLRVLTGEKAKQYGDRRRQVVSILTRNFPLVERIRWPRLISYIMPVYEGLKLRIK